MTKRIDPRRAEMVISRLRDANPMPERRAQTPEQIESFLLEVMERTDMVQHISKQDRQTGGSTTTRRRQAPPWLGLAVGVALAALVAIPVVLLDRGPDDPAISDPAVEGLLAAQATLISNVVEAIDTERFEDFQSSFAPDGNVAFETGINRPYHQGVEGGQPIRMTDAEGFEADFLWGAALDRRIALMNCESQTARIFNCEISFALEALRMEWHETMAVALNESGEIALLETESLDIDPADRQQPMGFAGYFEFEAWLEETHPDEYRRLVEPGTPGSINGVEIQLSFAPENPDLVPEVTALIDEYLASR